MIKDKTKICMAKTDILDECLFNDFYGKVSEERRRKIDALRFDKDRRLSLGAELILRETLRRYGYDPAREIKIIRGENGKPYLAGGGGIYFNLSHSGEYVMCAVSDRDIGCDIQKITDTDYRIAERFFTLREYENIAGQKTEEQRKDMFYRYWTLKESFLKATGKGISIPLDSFEIKIGDVVSIDQSVDERCYYFREYPFDDYKAAVCETDRPCDAEAEEIDLRDADI